MPLTEAEQNELEVALRQDLLDETRRVILRTGELPVKTFKPYGHAEFVGHDGIRRAVAWDGTEYRLYRLKTEFLLEGSGTK